jgi:hypothetical protein
MAMGTVSWVMKSLTWAEWRIDGGTLGSISGQGESRNKQGNDYLNTDMVEVAIDTLVRVLFLNLAWPVLSISQIRKPILGACEHNPIALCQLSLSAMEAES